MNSQKESALDWQNQYYRFLGKVRQHIIIKALKNFSGDYNYFLLLRNIFFNRICSLLYFD
jgi:hypothetical protein